MTLLGMLDPLPDIVFPGYIASYCCSVDRTGEATGRLQVDVGYHDGACAGPREGLTQRLANPAAAAGHHNMLVLELHCRVPELVNRFRIIPQHPCRRQRTWLPLRTLPCAADPPAANDQ